jgi:TatD DNase family protein
VIDFHCHLDLYPKPFEIASECRRLGVYVLSVTTTPTAWEGSRALSQPGDRIRVALGLHPQLAHERRSELDLFEQLLPQTRYVGEIGLDGSKEYKATLETQHKTFDRILRACARSGGKILSIHSRGAAASVLERLRAHDGAGVPVLHWFTGSQSELQSAVAQGCWFSVGPAMLRSDRGKALVTAMPRNRVLTETDGPFAQVNGRSASPLDIPFAEQELAALWGVELRDARAILRRNLRRLLEAEPREAAS